jgi:hypothetical protein
MTEISRFWDGTALGDAVAVGQAHLHDQFFRCVCGAEDNHGVVNGWRNELEVTGTSSPLSVATGGAVVYGMFYDNDAAVSVNVSTPSSGNSRYDRVVLRRDWSTYTVRVAKVTGVAAAVPAVPALTQGAGAIWEIPLATILVDDAGTITVTDTREYCQILSEWAANIVTAGMYEEGAVTAAKRPDRTRYKFRGANEIRPDSANPCVWAVGVNYDYWEFTDGVTTEGWAYFLCPESLVGTVDIYVWSVPDVNGAGGGAENCQWDYSIYYGQSGLVPTNATGTTNVDQQLRLNTTFYDDQIVAAVPLADGDLLAVNLQRDGLADSYNSDMRLLGIEIRWTADS